MSAPMACAQHSGAGAHEIGVKRVLQARATGIDGHRVLGLPHHRLAEALAKYGRLE